jgi:hypothetical protein
MAYDSNTFAAGLERFIYWDGHTYRFRITIEPGVEHSIPLTEEQVDLLYSRMNQQGSLIRQLSIGAGFVSMPVLFAWTFDMIPGDAPIYIIIGLFASVLVLGVAMRLVILRPLAMLVRTDFFRSQGLTEPTLSTVIVGALRDQQGKLIGIAVLLAVLGLKKLLHF